jgi:hypothetical protein
MLIFPSFYSGNNVETFVRNFLENHDKYRIPPPKCTYKDLEAGPLKEEIGSWTNKDLNNILGEQRSTNSTEKKDKLKVRMNLCITSYTNFLVNIYFFFVRNNLSIELK